jgi:hypothetical protein
LREVRRAAALLILNLSDERFRIHQNLKAKKKPSLVSSSCVRVIRPETGEERVSVLRLPRRFEEPKALLIHRVLMKMSHSSEPQGQGGIHRNFFEVREIIPETEKKPSGFFEVYHTSSLRQMEKSLQVSSLSGRSPTLRRRRTIR